MQKNKLKDIIVVTTPIPFISTPSARLLAHRSFALFALHIQHCGLCRQHKAVEAVEVEAGKIPIVPRWIQWGLKESKQAIKDEITAIEAVIETFEADAKLVDAVMDKIDGWSEGEKV